MMDAKGARNMYSIPVLVNKHNTARVASCWFIIYCRLNIIYTFKAAYNLCSQILRFQAAGISHRSLVDRTKFQRKLLTPFQVTPLSLVWESRRGCYYSRRFTRCHWSRKKMCRYEAVKKHLCFCRNWSVVLYRYLSNCLLRTYLKFTA